VHEKIPLRMLAELRRHAADHGRCSSITPPICGKRSLTSMSGLPVAFEVPVGRLDGAVVVELRLLYQHQALVCPQTS
jgi:hypothetical protein